MGVHLLPMLPARGGYGFGLTLAGQPKPLNLRIHVVLPGNMDTPLKLNVIGEIAEKAGESREEAVKVQLPGLMKPEVTTELYWPIWLPMLGYLLRIRCLLNQLSGQRYLRIRKVRCGRQHIYQKGFKHQYSTLF